MKTLINFPLAIFILSVLLLWLSIRLGAYCAARSVSLDQSEHHDFDIVMGTTLTLLGLIIGFSFSMAVSRYDQRKNYEEEEANAIGTEYLRADLLPVAEAAKVRQLLESYLEQRILFYTTRNASEIRKIDADTAQLQGELWSAVQAPAIAQPTPVVAVAVNGMNDVLNSQGYTQGAWWNRIPVAAWSLMVIIAIGAHLLVGYRISRKSAVLLFALPLIISITFFLIADIDSPRGGLIRLRPRNLVSLSASLHDH